MSLSMNFRTFFTTRRSVSVLTLLAGAMGMGACIDDPEPVTAIEATGKVSGILFFDRDNNNVYTPTAGDSAMNGVTVRLLDRGTTRVVGSGTTGANGRYEISVPVGTHDLDVVRSAEMIASNFIWCGAAPSVYRNEATFVQTPLKFGCVVRISAAKLVATGASVTIAGVVTAQPGRYRTANDNLYMQDLTGGIQVFGVPAALALQEGDSIEVTGVMAVFNTQLQITSPRVAPNIKRGAEIPDPLLLTTAQLAATTNGLAPNVGRLVRVRRVTVGTFASGNAPFDDGSGAAQVRLDGNAATTIGTTRFVTGRCYDITGIVGFFNNATQLQPRGPLDVTEVSCS
ncbi:hypothetical protein GAU_2198 [Gemmatimonas aurantiaca T-27]|uniref:Carboxypeptidase regulatory-like domain-containing protein n=2 Tax=Gemmatimonas aurantiaca TaxID=173480 RepID=C1A9R3_GEMAT|nr:hypothetical protein GAU_2198 [Gemmatimonas aurantiaca T-27]